MSESTGPKTWGDVIRQGMSGRYYLRNANSDGIEVKSAKQLAEFYGVTVDAARLGVKWVLLGCPPLTDPIPPETPDPVAKVVRWEPTKEDAGRIRREFSRWTGDMKDTRLWDNVLMQAIRDCQRDLPEVEPPTPPMPEDAKFQRIDELERLLLQIGDYAHDKSTGPAVDGYWAIRSLAYDGLKSDLPPTPPADRIADIESRLAALESRAILKPDYDPRDVALIPPPSPVDGWQDEPPTVDCPCWIETKGGSLYPVAWNGEEKYGTDNGSVPWEPNEITRYFPCPKPLTSPNPIGRSAYNTPTSFEQALTVGPPVAPEPEIPLPEGCTAIEGFPLLYMNGQGQVCLRHRGRPVLPWHKHEVISMKANGHSDAEISQAARYAIKQIATDAGLNVVAK